MKKIKLTTNLWLHEYIDKETYLFYERNNKLHKLAYKLDKELIMSDQMLRDYFGKVTINNWDNGGKRERSGLRTLNSSYYRKDSMHSVFKASDKIFEHATQNQIQNYVLINWKELGISAIELNVSWTHTDTRFIPYQNKLYTF